METKELPKPEWERYFDVATKNMRGQQVDVEIIGAAIGDAIQEENIPLRGLSYDPHHDAFFIHAATLEHQIAHPKSVKVAEEGIELRSVEILDENDNKQIIRMKSQKYIL